MTTHTAQSKQRTITLTDHAPIRIHEADWPIIAQVSDYAGSIECQARGIWAIFVREHRDGRRIVYGYHKIGPGGDYAGTPEPRAGGITNAAGTVAAIHAVALIIGHPETAADVIADLPAEVLS